MENKILLLLLALCSFSIIKTAAISGDEIGNIYKIVDAGSPKNRAELDAQIASYPYSIQERYRNRKFPTLEDLANKPNSLEMRAIFRLAMLDSQGPKTNLLNFIYDAANNKGIDLLNFPDSYGYIMLHEAILSKKPELVRFIKKFAQDKGVALDASRKTLAGDSAISLALGSPAMLQEIIGMPGVDVKQRLETGDTLLTLAIKLNLVDSIPLIATRENVNIRDNTLIDPNSGRALGETPLSLAERLLNNAQITQVLKSLGGIK